MSTCSPGQSNGNPLSSYTVKLEILTDAKTANRLSPSQYNLTVMGSKCCRGYSHWTPFLLAQNTLKELFICNSENKTSTTTSRKLNWKASALKVHELCVQTAGWCMKTQYKHLGTRATCKLVKLSDFFTFLYRNVVLQTYNRNLQKMFSSTYVQLTDSSLDRNECCWGKTKNEKHRARCFSTMQCEMKCFSHTESTSSSQSTNYYALCSIIIHLCIQLLHGSKNTKLFPALVLFLWKQKSLFFPPWNVTILCFRVKVQIFQLHLRPQNSPKTEEKIRTVFNTFLQCLNLYNFNCKILTA